MSTTQHGSFLHASRHSIAQEIIDWDVVCVRIPLVQHQGKAARVIVAEGQFVKVGQPLTSSDNHYEVPIHASIDGTVLSISDQQITVSADSSTQATPVNANQGSAQIPGNNIAESICKYSRQQFIENIHLAGLVGLGGSCFPVAAKLAKLENRPAQLLLINAAECDPAIRCDEVLLDKHIEKVASGIRLMQQVTQAAKTIIGIESDKADIGHTLLAEVNKNNQTQSSTTTELAIVPSSYPIGAEALLVSHCIGKTLNSREIQKSDIITFNVGTCYSLSQALLYQMPCTHRMTTVIDSRHNSYNLNLPLGAPVIGVLKYYEATPHDTITIVIGGEMMGTEAAQSSVITKATNCIQFKRSLTTPVARPCIRCSLCVDACPVNLMPQYLLSKCAERDHIGLQSLNLDHCIECACCDRVCPSHIPLAATFSESKNLVIQALNAHQQADLARSRFEKRQKRLEANRLHKVRNLDEKQSDLTEQVNSSQLAKRQLVEESLRRAREKKRSPASQQQVSDTTPGNTSASKKNQKSYRRYDSSS